MSYVGSQLAPGTTIVGYRVEALVGRGGMGAVYRASEEGLGRKVALKVIAPELAQDERFRERFLRESRVAASLDHPHVIPIYQAGEAEGVLFLAMRYVEGTDLAKLVAEEGALEPRRCLELLSQVAEALDAAHEKGLVHRDVKPSNVLIAVSAGREHCYLGDFGLTKRTGSLSGVSVAGEIVGTLEYVAPEQITGEALDERADVYSLGCVLYECLTGQAPFPRATDVALLWAHVHEEPTPPSKARSELPRELDTVLARALAKEPGRRYRSAGELIAATRSALRLVGAPPAERGRSRRLLVAGVTAGALVLLALVAGFLLMRGSGGLSSVSPDSVGVIDPASTKLVAEVAVGRNPESIVAAAGSVWAANVDDYTVSRIDPAATGERASTISLKNYPSDLAAAAGSLWVALGPLAELQRINPEQSVLAKAFPALEPGQACGPPQASLTYGAGYLWFACRQPELGRIDPATNVAVRAGSDLLLTSSSVNREFSDLAYGLESLWIVNRPGNEIIEVDPTTITIQRTIRVGQGPVAIAASPSALWVANYDDDTVTRLVIEGRGQPADTLDVPVGDGPVDVAFGEGAVWVANELDRTVTKIDPDSGDVVATIGTGNVPRRIAAGEGSAWVTVRAPEAESEEG